jgi:putative transposase
MVLETALNAEMTEHVGYEPHERAGVGNSRNGTRSKTVLTDVGPVQVDVPHGRHTAMDTAGSRRNQLDRHPNYILAAYMASGT